MFIPLLIKKARKSISNQKFIRIGSSQASQDAFVFTPLYEMEHKKDKGYYLEIGAADPIFINNTYFLEKTLNWDGASIDIDSEHQEAWIKQRRNPLKIQDAIQADYPSILKNFPFIIDYLSLDVDQKYDAVLKKIPLDKYTFKIITIEHDSYRFGEIYKKKEREILGSFGYQLLCPDVIHPEVVFI